jgi:hypothetical protein
MLRRMNILATFSGLVQLGRNGSQTFAAARRPSWFFVAALGLVVLTARLAHGQSDIDLTGYTPTFADEFDKVSWTNQSPKGDVKWQSKPSVGGKYIGYQMHDNDDMTIKDGVLVNPLRFKSAVDTAGSFCAGPVGRKDDSGKELISVGTPGAVKKRDDRLTWGGAGWVGMKFTTPMSGLTVGQLGIYNLDGNQEEHEVRIFDAKTGDDVAKAIVQVKGQPAGWVYAPVIGGAKALKAGEDYYLMCWQYSTHDGWYDGKTSVNAAGGITVSESEWGNWHAGSLFSIDTTGAGFTQQYGYWEVKAKLPASGKGTWPSFCTYTTGKSSLSEEIDIFEDYGGSFDEQKPGGFGMRNHNWGSGPKEASVDVWPPIPTPWTSWHIYGFLATPTKCVYYVDGEKKSEFATPTDYLNSPSYMTLEYNIGGGWPLTGVVANSELDVDWVRVWALPAKMK